MSTETAAAVAIVTTLGELVDAEPYLRRVCSLPLRSKEQPEGLTAKVKYHLTKLARLVAAETKHFTDERVCAFQDLGIASNQQITEIPPTVWTAFEQRMKPFKEIVVSIPWGPVKSSDIPLALASDLVGLGPLCELVEPPAEG